MTKKKGIRSKIKINPEHKTNQETNCSECRHSNQNTDDYKDNLIACKLVGRICLGDKCSVTMKLKDGIYYMYETYNNTNCTWDTNADFEVTYGD